MMSNSGLASLPRLQELLQPVDDVTLDDGSARGDGARREWLRAGDWRLLARPRRQPSSSGELIERFESESGATLEALQTGGGHVYVPFGLDDAYRAYVTETWREHASIRELSERQLRLYYRVKRFLPREFWLWARRVFIRWIRLPAFPAWPLESGVDRLLRFYALCRLHAAGVEEARFRWFWPERYRAALILTHDVESAEGLRLALDLADLEEERGVRSSFNVVGADYPIDEGILNELRSRGFEIGLHGLHHDRSLFSSREEFERQLPSLAALGERLGADGFRSPSTHRVVEWLPDLPVDYDCTVPHSDPYEPIAGGCCSLWPFMLGRIVELPYTLPQDHALLTLLRKRSVQPWLDQANAIEQRFGLIQCLTHPDRGYLGDHDKRAIYRELLDALVERDTIWKPLPREVARWWRRRADGETDAPEQLLGTMRIGAAAEYARFAPPAELSIPWSSRQRDALLTPCRTGARAPGSQDEPTARVKSGVKGGP
jgi:peptidoglycan/xylan/chitin deacetylase (PgdA/CDA1 family)